MLFLNISQLLTSYVLAKHLLQYYAAQKEIATCTMSDTQQIGFYRTALLRPGEISGGVAYSDSLLQGILMIF